MSNACYLQAHVTVLCSKWDTYCKPNSLNHSGNFMYRLLDQYKNSAGCQHTVNTCPIMATADSGSNTPAFIIETTTSTKWHLQNICIAFRPFSTARQISPPPVGQRLLYEFHRSYSGIPNSIELLWTSNRPFAGTSTCTTQETCIETNGGIRTRNPSKLDGRRPMTHIARPLGSDRSL